MTPGDIAFRFMDFLRHAKSSSDSLSESHVTVCDISQAMLDVGKRRAARRDCRHGQSCQLSSRLCRFLYNSHSSSSLIVYIVFSLPFTWLILAIAAHNIGDNF